MEGKIKDFLLIWLGALLAATGIYYFFAPNDIVSGGISGIAILINHYFPQIPMGISMAVMEIVLFTIGFIAIGPVFGSKTIFCSFSISGMIFIMETFFPIQNPISSDILIQLIFGVTMCGIGMGIAFHQNASTGGTDILAKILNQYFKIDIGKAVLMVDAVIIVFAITVFGIEKGMYGIFVIILLATIIDVLINRLNMCQQIIIISSHSEAIKEYILQELHRSATVYVAKGAFTNDDKEVIITIIDRKQFVPLSNHIKQVDDQAFMTVQHVQKVFGKGFAKLNG
ncbi:YitT family protein [Clostridiaceae bacterium 35-E11]